AGKDENTATVSAAIAAVPSSVGCIAIHVQGVSESSTRTFSVSPGQHSSFLMTGLPPGLTKFTGYAYPPSVTCSADALWMDAPDYQSDAVPSFLQPGSTSIVTLELKPVGSGTTVVDFFRWVPVANFGSWIWQIWGTTTTNLYAATSDGIGRTT